MNKRTNLVCLLVPWRRRAPSSMAQVVSLLDLILRLFSHFSEVLLSVSISVGRRHLSHLHACQPSFSLITLVWNSKKVFQKVPQIQRNKLIYSLVTQSIISKPFSPLAMKNYSSKSSSAISDQFTWLAEWSILNQELHLDLLSLPSTQYSDYFSLPAAGSLRKVVNRWQKVARQDRKSVV